MINNMEEKTYEERLYCLKLRTVEERRNRQDLIEVSTALRSSDEKAVCLSVRLSVCLSNAWFVTKRKKVAPIFLYHIKDQLP